MHHRCKLVLGGLAAVLALAIGIASASADRLRFSNQRTRSTWRSYEWRTGGSSVRCPLTLEGSLHSATIVKARALIGFITRATVHSTACTGGAVTVLQESLPWHVRYNGFFGVLPAFERIDWSYTGSKYLIFTAPSALTCTMLATEANPLVDSLFVESGGEVRAIRANEEAQIPLTGELGCAFLGNARTSGTGGVMLLGATTPIRITLI